jgi:hypothetical protein
MAMMMPAGAKKKYGVIRLRNWPFKRVSSCGRVVGCSPPDGRGHCFREVNLLPGVVTCFVHDHRGTFCNAVECFLDVEAFCQYLA